MNLLTTALAFGLLTPVALASLGQPLGHLQDGQEGYEELRARELGPLVARLKEHAEWCKKSKLWLQRSLAYEAVLQFDPDDENYCHRENPGRIRRKNGCYP